MNQLIIKTHKIKTTNRNNKRLQELGYICKPGDYIEILSNHLVPNSPVIVTAQCKICGIQKDIPMLMFTRYIKGFTCSRKCKYENTKLFLMETYGVENASELQKSKDKRKKTIKDRYGVDNISQLPSVREKIIKSCNERYGVDNVSQAEEIKKLKIETNLKNWGVEYPLQLDFFKDKLREIIQNKYGIEYTNCSQVASIAEKKLQSGIKGRSYIFPSGNTVFIEGYEKHGIDYLLSLDFTEKDLIIGAEDIEKYIGMVYYYNPIKNKISRYFPDIYIPKNNTVYEIKSEYTINLDREMVAAKKQAILEQNINFQFLIFNKKGVLVNL